MKKIEINKKLVKLGGYSLVVTAVVIAIAIIVNLAVNMLPSRMTKYSVMANDLYEISDEGKKIVQNVRDDVTVYIVCAGDYIDSEYNAIAKEYIIRYTELNSNIGYKIIDPVVNPGFVGTYTDESLDSRALHAIAVNNKTGRSRVIPNSEIFYQQYSEYEIYYYQMMGYQIDNPTYFGCEQALVSAIDYVTMEHLPTLYYTTGHGETALDETVTGLIDKENIALTELPLLTAGEIPADADAVLINVPTKDFTENEVKALSDYSDKGGNVVLVSSYNTDLDDRNLKNIYGFAENYGLSYTDSMVFEGSSNNYYSGYPYYLLPILSSDSFSASIPEGTNVVMLSCHPITVKTVEGVTATELMTTTVNAYSKSVIDQTTKLEKEDGDAEGKFCVGAMAEKNGSKLVWFSSGVIADSGTNGYFSNVTYFMAVIDSLCEKENNVSLSAKALQIEALSVSEGSANLWGIILIGVIPVAVLASGFVVWRRRARR